MPQSAEVGYPPGVATFAENLKRLRIERRMSQEVLADRLGLKRQATVSAWETGRRKPRPATVRRIAKALACEPADLFVGVKTDYDEVRGSAVPLAPAPEQPVISAEVLAAVRDERIGDAAIALTKIGTDRRKFMIALLLEQAEMQHAPSHQQSSPDASTPDALRAVATTKRKRRRP